MDQELKDLLREVIIKLEGFEKRVAALESVSHKQVTEEDLRMRYDEFVRPQRPATVQTTLQKKFIAVC